MDEKRVRENREKAREMSASGALLLKLVAQGIKREDAYREIQRTVHQAIDQGISWKTILTRDPYFKNRVDEASQLFFRSTMVVFFIDKFL